MERGSYESPSIKKLLLVEDNSATVSRLGERLAQQGVYQVIVASDCVTALKFLRFCKPDLMLVMRAYSRNKALTTCRACKGCRISKIFHFCSCEHIVLMIKGVYFF